MVPEIKKWPTIQRTLAVFEHADLISLIGELYKLNDDNKYFINARCSETCVEAAKPYKLLVKRFISPDIPYDHEGIQKAKAQKAIHDYWRATGDPYGKIDLMLYYVECGTQFTLEYGDVDETSYNSLVSIFKQTITEIKKAGQNQLTKNFILRLHKIVVVSENIGWGYGDEVKALFTEANFQLQ